MEDNDAYIPHSQFLSAGDLATGSCTENGTVKWFDAWCMVVIIILFMDDFID